MDKFSEVFTKLFGINQSRATFKDVQAPKEDEKTSEEKGPPQVIKNPKIEKQLPVVDLKAVNSNIETKTDKENELKELDSSTEKMRNPFRSQYLKDIENYGAIEYVIGAGYVVATGGIIYRLFTPVPPMLRNMPRLYKVYLVTAGVTLQLFVYCGLLDLCRIDTPGLGLSQDDGIKDLGRNTAKPES